jgi:hypothetical protein
MAERVCKAAGCESTKLASRGLCWGHYQRFLRYGHPFKSAPKLTPEEQMMRRVAQSAEGCWLYDAPGTRRRPRLLRNGRYVMVRDLVYEHLVGPIPEGHVLSPICPHLHCVRPDHGEVVAKVAA